MTIREMAPPTHPKWNADGYSNFDHTFDIGEDALAAILRDGGVAPHSAWDHHGALWYEDGQFHEQVSAYGQVVGVVSAPTLAEVVAEVNERWGDL